MRRQSHRPLFNKRVRFESKDRFGNKEQRSYIRQGVINSAANKLKKWLKGFFGKNKQIQALDLRSDPSRGHGAKVLRAWWPELGKMVSTRDGRPV